jgi:hypothetical protein
MHLASIIFTFATIVLPAGSAVAGPFEDGTTARKNGDYKMALGILKQEQRQSARRRDALDAENARRNAAIDQEGANYWDDREKARRRANGGTGF